ncbi:hypothetical protein N9V91_02355 [Acidimicrobiaceae bacterium]|nr:hypothetical protein [Acidimicrobiaceae bacterium]
MADIEQFRSEVVAAYMIESRILVEEDVVEEQAVVVALWSPQGVLRP